MANDNVVGRAVKQERRDTTNDGLGAANAAYGAAISPATDFTSETFASYVQVAMEKQVSPAKRPIGRPREFDVESALDRAIPVFRERGYGGASVEALQTTTGLTVGSLYKAFGHKRGLFAAAYHRYVEARRTVVAASIGPATTARERVVATLHAYLNAASGDEGRRGCLVVAGLIEASTLEPSLREAVETTLADNRASLVALLEEGRRDGSIRADLAVEPGADLLLALLQGLRAIGKLRDPVDPDSFVTLALKALD